MSGPAEQFEAAIEKVRDVESHTEGEYLHEYDAVLTETGEAARIITLPPEFADDEAATNAFSRVTGQWYNANTHPNIVAIVERESTPRPWIATDQPQMTSLKWEQSRLTPDDIKRVVADTAEALRTLALYNAVHGMLTPDDILVAQSGDNTQVRGVGLEHAVRTALDEWEPTPYTAPELLDDPDQPTEQTDVYGLGAITYFALTGQPPVDGPDLERAIRDGPATPPSEGNDEVGPALDDVVMQALSTHPTERQDSPHAFKRAFLSAFDADAFGTETDEETGERDQSATTDAATATGDAATAERTEQQATAEEASGRVTRRATLSLLGIGAVGGTGAFLLRDELRGSEGTGRPAGDAGTSTGQTTQTATDQPVTETQPPEPDFGGFLADTSNYDGTTADFTGWETVTIDVGVAANGGDFGFGPPAVHIDTGTTVQWDWTGDGGSHNVVSDGEGPLDSGSVVSEAGVHYEHTFGEDGVFNYYCVPHQSLGMKGAIVVGTEYPTVSDTES